MARLGMVQIALLVSRGCVPVQSQQVFHLLDGQEWNKHCDACSLLKLVRFGAQNLFDFGNRTRELISYILYDAVPLRWLVLKRRSLFLQICNWYIHRKTPALPNRSDLLPRLLPAPKA
jgi:hypothetical protein